MDRSSSLSSVETYAVPVLLWSGRRAQAADVRRARTLILEQRLDEGLALLEQIEAYSKDLRADADVLRAMAAMFRDDASRALHLAQRALQRGALARWANVAARALCQFAYWRLRDFAGLDHLTLPPAGAWRYRPALVVSLCVDAALELEQLRVSVAARLARRALAQAERGHPPGRSLLAALPASLLAQALYEQGALDEAEAVIRARLAAIRAGVTFEAAGRAYRVLARVAALRGQTVVALAVLQEAEQLAQRRGWPILAAVALCERVRLLVSRGRRREAQACVTRLEQWVEPSAGLPGNVGAEVQRCWRIAEAQLASPEPTARTLETLRRLHQEAMAARDLHSATQWALEIVGTLECLGARREADQLLLQTLSRGAFAGLHQTFADGHQAVAPVLRRSHDRAGQAGSGCRDLLPYIGSLLQPRKSRARAPVRPFNGLSARECDILLLVCRGLSNKRIAYTLTIAPETVKAHVKRIFIKLKVSSRAEAVFRASALGLLPGMAARSP